MKDVTQFRQDGGWLNAEAMANGRLIAASKRLLEALEETYTNLRRWRDEKPELWDAIIDSGMMDAWDKSRAAIEAAREG